MGQIQPFFGGGGYPPFMMGGLTNNPQLNMLFAQTDAMLAQMGGMYPPNTGFPPTAVPPGMMPPGMMPQGMGQPGGAPGEPPKEKGPMEYIADIFSPITNLFKF